jgi:outer membrane protein TolC
MRFLGLAALVLASGCVIPEGVGTESLDRYQRALVDRGPQTRGQEGLDPLRPAPGSTGPAMRITKDPQTGKSQLSLTLDEALVRALTNDLEIRTVAFTPSINRQDMVKAAAEFDYIAFGGFNYRKDDKRSLANRQLDPNAVFDNSQALSRTYQAGIKNKTVTGATWALGYTMIDTWDNSTFYQINRRFEPVLALDVTQPLLRNAWPEYNLAQLKLARVNYRSSMVAFRQKVEEVATNVINAYWALVQARGELKIQQELLKYTLATLERVRARSELDATAVQIKQIEAAAESRRATMIRAEKTILDVQDQLARLLNDADINVVTDLEIVPVTEPVTTPVAIDLTDKLLTALRHNPVLEQARLAVDAAVIGIRIAANQALPKLDLTASASLQGMGTTANASEENMETGDYASYGFALVGEYPIGNRAAEADLRRQKLTRLQNLTQMQNAADAVALDVKERIRQIGSSHEEMQAQNAALEAAWVQLRALEDTERIRGQLTPEFLQVKLSAQEAVANSARQKLASIVQFNSALADLDRATGTTLDVHRLKVALVPATEGGYWPQPSAASPSPMTAPTSLPSQSTGR